MTIGNQLLSEIREYLAATGIAATTFGKVAGGNAYIVEKLETGRTITVETADRVRAYIKANPPSKQAIVPRPRRAA